MTRKIAIVEWEDAVAAKDDLGSWLRKDEFDAWCREPLARIKSVGYLTFECDKFIALSQSILGGEVAENTKIPRINIVRMTIIEEKDFDKTGIKYVRQGRYGQDELRELIGHLGLRPQFAIIIRAGLDVMGGRHSDYKVQRGIIDAARDWCDDNN